FRGTPVELPGGRYYTADRTEQGVCGASADEPDPCVRVAGRVGGLALGGRPGGRADPAENHVGTVGTIRPGVPALAGPGWPDVFRGLVSGDRGPGLRRGARPPAASLGAGRGRRPARVLQRPDPGEPPGRQLDRAGRFPVVARIPPAPARPDRYGARP